MFSPKRKACLSAFCFCLGASAAPALAQSDLVFESPEARLEVSVARIEPVFMHGRPSVQFALDDPSSEAFAKLTGEMVGRKLAVSLCDHVLVKVVVQERLEGRGIINLPTIEAAIAVADVIQGTAECPTLAAHFHE
jgi:preprotein translocase subunit SecD